MMNETTFEVTFAYGEAATINASNEAKAHYIAAHMGRACGLGKPTTITQLEVKLPKGEVDYPDTSAEDRAGGLYDRLNNQRN